MNTVIEMEVTEAEGGKEGIMSIGKNTVQKKNQSAEN